MIRSESVGDWLVMRAGSALLAKGCRYSVEFDAQQGRGKLCILPSPDASTDHIELSYAWPSDEPGELTLIDRERGSTVERFGVVLVPGIVYPVATGADGSEQKFSGFEFVVIPHEPSGKVVPFEEMAFGLRDGGELAAQIESDAEQPAPQTPRDQAELGQMVRTRVLEMHPDASVTTSADSVMVEWADGQQHEIQLANAWARIQSGETDVLEHFLKVVKQPETAVATDPQRIFPLLKPAGTAAAFVESAAQLAPRDEKPPEQLLCTPLLTGLECLYVLDARHGMTFVTPSALSDAGISAEALPAHARSGLYASLNRILRAEVQPGVHMLTCGGNYEASLILVPEVWAEIDPLLDGQRVVGIPNRDLLFVTGSNNRTGIAWMREVASAAPNNAYPVFSELLRWNGAAYELFSEKKSWFKRLF
ncbi:MAG: hypothetical protein QM756_05885 [Polyangiaceae bacterium]